MSSSPNLLEKDDDDNDPSAEVDEEEDDDDDPSAEVNEEDDDDKDPSAMVDEDDKLSDEVLTENVPKTLSKAPCLVAKRMSLTLHLLLFKQSM